MDRKDIRPSDSNHTAKFINIDKDTVWKISPEDLNMKKVCAKVPRVPTAEQTAGSLF